MREQFQIITDPRVKQSHHVRAGGNRHPRPRFLAAGRPSDLLPLLQYHDFLAGSCKVRRGGEPVVTGAHHYHILLDLIEPLRSARPICHDARINNQPGGRKAPALYFRDPCRSGGNGRRARLRA